MFTLMVLEDHKCSPLKSSNFVFIIEWEPCSYIKTSESAHGGVWPWSCQSCAAARQGFVCCYAKISSVHSPNLEYISIICVFFYFWVFLSSFTFNMHTHIHTSAWALSCRLLHRYWRLVHRTNCIDHHKYVERFICFFSSWLFFFILHTQ